MYKWLTAAAFGSAYLYLTTSTSSSFRRNLNLDLQNNNNNTNLIESSSNDNSKFNWTIPIENELENDVITSLYNNDDTYLNDFTHNQVNLVSQNLSNQFIELNNCNLNFQTLKIVKNTHEKLHLSNVMPFLSQMIYSHQNYDYASFMDLSDITESNYCYSGDHIQNRLDYVTQDIMSLSSKLNSSDFSFDNLLNDNVSPLIDSNGFHGEPDDLNSTHINNEEFHDKTWKCPSEFGENKTLNANSTSSYHNPFSELSESTQKILNRLKMKEKDNQISDDFDEEFSPKHNFSNEAEFDLEEDILDFNVSYSTSTPTGLIQSYLNRTVMLPIIEETEQEHEWQSSSDEDDEEEEEEEDEEEEESHHTTVIENKLILSNRHSQELSYQMESELLDLMTLQPTPDSTLSRDSTVTTISTTSDSFYPSAATTTAENNQTTLIYDNNNKDLQIAEEEENAGDFYISVVDDTETPLSDFAYASVSSETSLSLLQIDDSPLQKQQQNYPQTDKCNNFSDSSVYLNDIPTDLMDVNIDIMSKSMNANYSIDSDQYQEFDNNNNNNNNSNNMEDNEVFHGDFMSSMPDLQNEVHSNKQHHNHTNRSSTQLINKSTNKSTDLDSFIVNHQHRLSVSTGNLRPKSKVKLDHTNTISSSRANHEADNDDDNESTCAVMETDLDSGFVSLYQPNKSQKMFKSMMLPQYNKEFNVEQTELYGPSGLQLNYSMMNLSMDSSKSRTLNNANDSMGISRGRLLAEMLRSRAQSIPELRIAESITQLNIPEWVNVDNFLSNKVPTTLPSSNIHNSNSLRADHYRQKTSPTSSLYAISSSTESTIQQHSSLPPKSQLEYNLAYSPRSSQTVSYKSTASSTNTIISPRIHESNMSSLPKLPSQIMKLNKQNNQSNNLQKSPQPINLCQARLALLPNKFLLDQSTY